MRIDPREPNLHSAAASGELHGVRQQVPEHLLQAFGISRHRTRLRIEHRLQTDASGICRRRHGVEGQDLLSLRDSPAARALIAELCAWARALMADGAPLVHRIPGRAGWELRLVVQGGLRILDRLQAMRFAALLRRPTVGAADAPLLLWRALTMNAISSNTRREGTAR